MTPQDKAQQLVEKYGVFCYWNRINNYDKVKELAVIAVDEILEVIYDSGFKKTYDYWQQVKQEIENL